MNELVSASEVEAPAARPARLRGGLRGALRFALDVALPPLCPSCREPLGDGAGLCASCWSKLSLIEKPYCARLGIPFAILRCISDEAGADLPPAIAVAMHPDGRLALGAILKSILTNPAQLPELMRSTARFGRAFASLEAGARLAFNQT